VAKTPAPPDVRPSVDRASRLRPSLPRERVAAARIPSGVLGLDDLVDGGFPPFRTVLLCGDIGTGKTTFGLQFVMEGVKRGESTVFVSVDEKPRHLVEDTRRLGWDLGSAVEQRQLTLLDASPFFTSMRGRHRLDARQVASDLSLQVRRAQATRLVVDGAASLSPEAGEGVEDFFRSLVASLEDNLGCTSILTVRTAGGRHSSAVGSIAERLTSGVIELKVGPPEGTEPIGGLRGNVRRSLEVRKMRGAPVALGEWPFDIVDGRGIVLFGH
jgi:circadian clock protein KaiC